MRRDLTLVCILNALYKDPDPVFIYKKTDKDTKQKYGDLINKERKDFTVCPFLDDQDYDLVRQLYSSGIEKGSKRNMPNQSLFFAAHLGGWRPVSSSFDYRKLSNIFTGKADADKSVRKDFISDLDKWRWDREKGFISGAGPADRAGRITEYIAMRNYDLIRNFCPGSRKDRLLAVIKEFEADMWEGEKQKPDSKMVPDREQEVKKLADYLKKITNSCPYAEEDEKCLLLACALTLLVTGAYLREFLTESILETCLDTDRFEILHRPGPKTPAENILIGNFRKNRDPVYSREAQLEKIDTLLKSQGTDQSRIVYIQGIGGIGKSTLAKAYAEKHKDDYDVIAEVSAGAAKEAVLKLPSTIDAEAAFHVRLGRICTFCRMKKVLLIVHDYNSPEDETFGLWNDLGCDILLTGWFDRRPLGLNTILLETGDLSEEKAGSAAEDIFRDAYLKDAMTMGNLKRAKRLEGILKEEKESIRQLCAMAGFHPLTIRVMAMQSSCMPGEELRPSYLVKKLRSWGLSHEKGSPFVMAKDEKSHRYGNAMTHLKNVFSAASEAGTFTGREYLCLSNMILVPYEWGISAGRFRNWTGAGEDYLPLSDLCRRGWLEYSPQEKDILDETDTDDGVYRMPMAIKEVLSGTEAAASTIGRCRCYLDHYLNRFLENEKNYMMREDICCIGETAVRYLKEEKDAYYARILHRCADDMHECISRPYRRNLCTETVEKALLLFRETLGGKDKYTSECCTFLGICNADSGKPEKGMQYMEEGLKINLDIYGEISQQTALSYNYLGSACENHNPRKALEYHIKALNVYRQLMAREAQPSLDLYNDTARSINNVGQVMWIMGDRKEGLRYMEEALKMRIETLGEERAVTASSYNNVGYCYVILGNSKEGRDYIEKGLKIRKSLLGEENAYIASSYDNLGKCCEYEGDLKSCLIYREKAFAIRRAVYGEDSPLIAESYNAIGGLYWKMGAREEGIRYMEKAMKIRKKLLGETYATARSMINLGMCLIDYGKTEEGFLLLEEALKIRRKILGEEDPVMARSCFFIAQSYAEAGQYEKALEHMKEANTISSRHKEDKDGICSKSEELIGIYKAAVAR